MIIDVKKYTTVLTCLFLLFGCGKSKEEVVKVTKYSGSKKSWEAFLNCWDSETLKVLERQKEFYSPYEERVFRAKSQMISKGSLNNVAMIEEKLKKKLPQSYKDFLTVADGWIQLKLDAEDAELYGVDDVDFLHKKHPDIIAEWALNKKEVVDEKYFNYSSSQDATDLRVAYLESAIVISEVVDSGVYLLIPDVANNDGEWEAWFLGWELPGALRFRSFAELMKYAYIKSTKEPDFEGVYADAVYVGTCAEKLMRK